MGNKHGSFLSVDPSKFAKKKVIHNGDRLVYAVCHMKGWRQYMEDACLYVDNFPKNNQYLFGVFDGHGGPEVAQYVHRHFAMQLFLNEHYQNKEYGQALIETFNAMDEGMRSQTGKKELLRIIKHNISIGNRQKMECEEQIAGTTANVCLVTDDQIYVANAGDSRTVACCNGRTVPLSYDHKPEDKVEYRRIRKAGGFVHHGRINHALNMSRSLGDLEFKKNWKLKKEQQMIISTPDVIGCKREGVKFIIMGCDGIWQRKSNEEMVEWIKRRLAKHIEPVSILQQLFDEELSEDEEGFYGTDNMSAILIVFKR